MLSRRPSPEDDKLVALRHHRALNPKPQAVRDPAFISGNPFFDSRDLVQVKYEMLRRVREEGQPASQAAATFGFSRPSFYAAQSQFEKAGLPGLVRERPGPRRAHKLSEEVVDFLEQALSEEPAPKMSQLVELLRERYRLSVHPRRHRAGAGATSKKGARDADAAGCGEDTAELSRGYEEMRAQVTGVSAVATPRGLTLFMLRGLVAWMNTWRGLMSQPGPVSIRAADPVAVIAPTSELASLLADIAISRWLGVE